MGETRLHGVEMLAEREVDRRGVVGTAADHAAKGVDLGEVRRKEMLIGQRRHLTVHIIGPAAERAGPGCRIARPAGAGEADRGEVVVAHDIGVRLIAGLLAQRGEVLPPQPAMDFSEINFVGERRAILVGLRDFVPELAEGVAVGHEVAGIERPVREVAIDVEFDDVECVGSVGAVMPAGIAREFEVEAVENLLLDERGGPAAVVALLRLVPRAAIEICIATQTVELKRIDGLHALGARAAEGVGLHHALKPHVHHRIREFETCDVDLLLRGILSDGVARIKVGHGADQPVGAYDARGDPEAIATGIDERAVGRGPRDSLGHEINRGAAVRQPLDHAAVERPGERDDVPVVAVVLVVDGDFGVGQGPGCDTQRQAVLIDTLEAPEFAFFRVEQVEAEGEAVFDERLVVVECDAVRGPAVILRLQLGFPVLQLCALGRGDGGALRLAHADEQGVGSARERQALEVVVVGGLEGIEEVVRERLESVVAGVGEAANRIGLARAAAEKLPGGVAVVARGVVALDGIDTRGEQQRLVEGVYREVLHELGGKNGERCAHVAQIGAHARAGERLGGGVAVVFVGGDLEGREDDGVGRRGSGRAGGGGRRERASRWGRCRAADGEGGRAGVAHELESGAREHPRDGFLEGEVAAHGGNAHALHDGSGEHDLATGLLGGETERGGGVAGRKVEVLRRSQCGQRTANDQSGDGGCAEPARGAG